MDASPVQELLRSPREGDPALSLLQYIAHETALDTMTVFRHSVGINWRQQFSPEERGDHLDDDCFDHNDKKARDTRQISGDELRSLTIGALLAQCGPDEVFSVGSKVEQGSDTLHLPMMNFHPEVQNGREFVLKSLAEIRKRDPRLVPPGALVSSGRYWHYYGFELYPEEDLPRFLSHFLMPSILVSPRYIGHCLYEGQSSLRLTNDMTAKTQLPFIDTLVD